MGPALTELTVADAEDAWQRAGFRVTDGSVRIGPVEIVLRPPSDLDDQDTAAQGVTAWAFDWTEPSATIDGITTRARSSASLASSTGAHPNGITAFDHVVLRTDDLDRTSAALTAAGFESRRRREVPKSDPPMAQVFWWAGAVILELVGPLTPTGEGPASIWGLALVSNDLDATADLLGDAMSTPRPAVQKGRRIAAIKGRELGLSVPIAVMTPHDPSARA